MPAKTLKKVRSVIKLKTKSKGANKATKRRESKSPKLVVELTTEKKNNLPKPSKPPKKKTKDESSRQFMPKNFLARSQSFETVKFS